MDALTIQEAAETTGWSPRMLRYIERIGLVEANRSGGGYRLYGPAQLQRLRTLRELLQRFDIGLSDVGFAARLRQDALLRQALEEWFEAKPHRPDDVPAAEWLSWEQDKHQRLLRGSARQSGNESARQSGNESDEESPHEESAKEADEVEEEVEEEVDDTATETVKETA